MRSSALGPCLFCLTLLGGCATTTDAQTSVAARAAFDFDCPEVQIEDLPGAAYGIRGCGVRAVYVFDEPGCGDPRQHGKKEYDLACTPTLDHATHDGQGKHAGECPHCKGSHAKGEHEHRTEGGDHDGDAGAKPAGDDDPEAPTARDPDAPVPTDGDESDK